MATTVVFPWLLTGVAKAIHLHEYILIPSHFVHRMILTAGCRTLRVRVYISHTQWHVKHTHVYVGPPTQACSVYVRVRVPGTAV